MMSDEIKTNTSTFNPALNLLSLSMLWYSKLSLTIEIFMMCRVRPSELDVESWLNALYSMNLLKSPLRKKHHVGSLEET